MNEAGVAMPDASMPLPNAADVRPKFFRARRAMGRNVLRHRRARRDRVVAQRAACVRQRCRASFAPRFACDNRAMQNSA
ncbi:hypothetical protein K4L06_10650 [Lysobacter sp. BMK333-48F3]|uniref:hypothetical protein n=1 Tax=Lysobacter sp. BMK333-48F3 TaxID=2867962 RepID=UPI001C8B4E9E|nr:hypothetical protein [Lysobacter sp. BMK333-48F3]MBX9401772.1 hypothetical protein [Lysobacter sp. BMK333-48F3]